MSHALWFVIETLGSLLASAALLRALAWRCGVSPRDPVNRFVMAATDWLVKPLRRALPLSRTQDWASVAAAAVIAAVIAVVWALLFRGLASVPEVVLPLSVYWLLKWAIHLLMGLVLLQALMSWINPRAPIAPTVERLTTPFLAPLQRMIPLVGGVDLSPIALLLLAQLVLALLESLFVWSAASLG